MVSRSIRQRPGALSGGGGIGIGVAVAVTALGVWWGIRQVRTRRTKLTGQVAVITGGARGLGFLIARELAREGCRIVICARDQDELDRARRDLLRESPDVQAIPCDVSDPGQVERFLSETMHRFGRIDVLVNNAGIIQVAPLDRLELADFQAVMAANFWGTVHASLGVVPQMRARRSGRIVNVTSIGGKVSVPHLLPYNCAKFAAVGFSEGLRAELAKDGVCVTTVVPGLMRTGSYKFARFRGQGEYRWFSRAARAPGITISATRAARLIVRAAKRGDPQPVIGFPAKVLNLFKSLFPDTTSRALDVTNRLLPSGTAS